MSERPEPCRDFFSQERNRQEIKGQARQLDEAFPNCLCEKHSVSEYSPGPVDGREKLIRLIIWPNHIIPETGEIKPTAFDSAQYGGLSVNRDGHCSDELLKAAVEELVSSVRQRATEENPNSPPESAAQWLGVSVCECEEIRSVTDDSGQRKFCVYDTAKRDNPSHADVFKTRAIKGALMRKVIHGSFSKLIKAGEFRTGKVADMLPADFVSE